MHFQLMHESLARFSESFASFLYGLNMNAFCVDFPEVRVYMWWGSWGGDNMFFFWGLFPSLLLGLNFSDKRACVCACA